MECTLRNKLSVNEVWIINLALILYVATTIISKHSSVTASDDASSLWYLQNDTAVTYFGNETSAETTYISSSSTQTVNPSESLVSDSSSTLSSPTIELTTNPAVSISTTHEPDTATAGPATTTPDPSLNQHGNSEVIIGVVVGGCLLMVLLAVLFVYQEPLMGYCNIGRKNDVRLPAFAPYVLQDQEPENSGTAATLSSFEYQIREEFQKLASYNPAISSNIAHLEENANKNRYRDVVPYDFNIVRLKSGNYINASHVESRFVLTQDPIMMLDDDFWPMVWEHNVSIIVRLSNDHEDRTLPIAVYIPRIRGVVGQLEVTVSDALLRTNYCRQTIRLNDAPSSVRRPSMIMPTM